MSKEYGKSQDVPNVVLADRLDELSGSYKNIVKKFGAPV